MWAARAYEDAEGLRLEEIPEPELGPGEVLVRVRAAGLVQGMISFWKFGLIPGLPVTLGHEIAGTVERVGPGVSESRLGERVRVHANLSCRQCEFCLTDREAMCEQASLLGARTFGPASLPLHERYKDGGFAEFARAPEWLLDPLPDNVSFEVGAKVHDLANAVRALKLADLRLGATVAILAATGAMGTAAVRMAPFFGVKRLVLIGRSRERLQGVAASSAVATEIVALEDLGDGWEEKRGLATALQALAPIDAVLDFLPGGPLLTQGLAGIRIGGTAVTMSPSQSPVALPVAAIMVNCWRIVGTRSCTRADALEVIELLRAGRLVADDLVTHRFDLRDINAAVAAVMQRGEPLWMCVIDPTESAPVAGADE
jgi:threonine dehydrogenase-like Zn-dependent dehydrogenase